MTRNDFTIIYDCFKSSGLSITYFCENEGYSKSSFYYWRKKFLSQKSSHGLTPITIARPEKAELVPQRVSELLQENPLSNMGNGDKITLEIKRPNGTEISLNGDINPSVLIAIINQLQ